ncbi:hypothetical protein TP70_02200 [Staphylococcus microti]|uniref:Uncharacterized protein n=1 Tax=Staphylococcus microti TaxID=569857 RepID=A0A0D6XSQ0_9STAP|nr:hypothetical protein [Staphylococcus microti]KIX91445.1 hypothetical protein TP70_02200 [Staphylococcus microti]PNZ82490.1 hypothetical protein CD132_04120 [Staphylococcus microti]PNZ83675.1 hypothetical protein CD132_01990 [Staphylococcus microti]SUM57019.1 Uncharacterised protein [Staphylococcus microti]
MNKPSYVKIALLIVILVEEIRNARSYKKAIGKPFSINMNVETQQLKEIVEDYVRKVSDIPKITERK